MPLSMKAIQITRPFTLDSVSLDPPVCGEGDVLLAIRFVGFCGSDLNTYRGGNALAKQPVIPGHEVGAEIVRVGSRVPERIRPGMTVTVNPYTACGDCAACRNRRYNACEHNETLGVQRDGAMQEYLAVPWQKVIVAEGLSAKHCALVEPMSVGFHAVDRAQVTDSDTVLVLGCGMIGVGAIVRASLRGATVIAVDLDGEKLAVAKDLGATFTVNAAEEDVRERVAGWTDGRMADVVIEAVGSPATQTRAIECACFTGRVVFIGYAKEDTTFHTRLFVQKELTVFGSRNAQPEDFRAVVRYLRRGTCPCDRLVSAVVKPEEAAAAMAAWHADPRKVFRILVEFQSPAI